MLFSLLCCCVVPQVMFPSGTKVKIVRTGWGMDVSLFTPRAKNIANEKGLCLEPKNNEDHNSYGNRLRYARYSMRSLLLCMYLHPVSSLTSLANYKQYKQLERLSRNYSWASRV